MEGGTKRGLFYFENIVNIRIVMVCHKNTVRTSDFFIEIRAALFWKVLIYQGFPIFIFWGHYSKSLFEHNFSIITFMYSFKCLWCLISRSLIRANRIVKADVRIHAFSEFEKINNK